MFRRQLSLKRQGSRPVFVLNEMGARNIVSRAEFYKVINDLDVAVSSTGYPHHSSLFKDRKGVLMGKITQHGAYPYVYTYYLK